MARLLIPIVDDRHDRWAFAMAFVAGVVSIVALRFLLPDGLAWFYILAPITVLLIYSGYVLTTSRASISLDRAGDNIYYLGLLFTLISLSISLYLVAQPDDRSGGFADQLILGFGVALSSTIIGMFMRIMVQQMRHDPVDVERTARLELGEAARSLRTELFAILADLSSYRRGITQSLQEISEEITVAIRETSEQSGSAIESAAHSLQQVTAGLAPIEGILERIRTAEEGLASVTMTLHEASNQSVSAVEGLASAAKNHTDALRAMEEADLKSSANAAAIKLEDAATAAGRVASNLEEISGRFREASEEAIASQTQLNRTNDALATSLKMAADVESELVASVRKLRKEVRGA